MQIITDIFIQLLTLLNDLTGNLGLAIITFTFLIRSALLPISLPSLKATKKMQDLQPEISKLKKKHKNDNKALQQAQMELYKKYNVNPLAGCLPQLVQLGVLIFLYQALISFLNNATAINMQFLWLDLSKSDQLYVMPVLAAVTQLILSLMIAPGAETPDIVPNVNKSKKVREENKKEEDVAEMAKSMQQQMLFIMPIMTGFFALRFPSGLALYWVATTVFSVGQQYYISGFGGLKTYWLRLMALAKLQK
jgi:YidC/Oxa1 family membrane protein insertase